jgi:hypothetical protein
MEEIKKILTINIVRNGMGEMEDIVWKYLVGSTNLFRIIHLLLLFPFILIPGIDDDHCKYDIHYDEC